MKLITFLSLIVLPLSGLTQHKHLHVKSDKVKISFLADMQKTEGTIGGFKAVLHFDTENLSVAHIKGSVDVATINTGVEKRDEHLKSSDYFDMEKYPKMTFNSTSITKEGDKYVMKGKLKIKDVEREETITFTFEDNVFKAECTIQAANYGIFEKKGPKKTNVKISFAIPVE